MALQLVDLLDSANQKYDNTESGLTATKVQAAVDELASLVGEAGTGDVVGPASAVDSKFASFNGTTGKLVKDSGFSPADFVFLPSFFWEGTTTASQLMCHAVLTSAASFASALAGSYGYADIAATAQTDFDVQHNGSSIGTVRWAAAANVPTFIAASPVSASAGHRVKIIGPATPDATLAGISVTLKMTRG